MRLGSSFVHNPKTLGSRIAKPIPNAKIAIAIAIPKPNSIIETATLTKAYMLKGNFSFIIFTYFEKVIDWIACSLLILIIYKYIQVPFFALKNLTKKSPKEIEEQKKEIERAT